jgi:nitrilase
MVVDIVLRFDVNAAVEKTCSLIAEAASNGAQIIGFPELWIPGYPVFIYAHKANVIYDYCRKYYRNAIDVNSQHMQTIRAAARDAKIMVVLGIAERDRGSLYMAQTFIGPDGNILLHRRKFKPTSFERVVFGDAVSHPLYSTSCKYSSGSCAESCPVP